MICGAVLAASSQLTHSSGMSADCHCEKAVSMSSSLIWYVIVQVYHLDLLHDIIHSSKNGPTASV